MKIYNYYCVKYGNEWIVLHNWDYEDFKSFPKFGLDVETRKEAIELTSVMKDELKQRLADLCSYNRVA